MEKTCTECSKTFESSRHNAKYCSRECRYSHNQLYFIKSSYPGISTGTVGAIGELRVSMDLLIKGFEVFRAVSPSCSCDLAILRNGILLRVEVRTGYEIPKTGKMVFNQVKNNKADVLAIVLRDRIVYQPDL